MGEVLEYLDRILLKLALTNDANLSQEIERFLTPVIGHLSTTDEKVRTKVLIFFNFSMILCAFRCDSLLESS